MRVQKKQSFLHGQIYSLDEIKSITQDFKFILSRPSIHGLFFLYKHKETRHLWIGGPFQGENSNLFLYVGPQTLPKKLTTSFSSIIRRNLENDWKKLKESREQKFLGLTYADSLFFQAWAKDFFKFDNRSFANYFD